MSKVSIYKMVLRQYEKDKMVAEELYGKRLEEVYCAVPRIREIDIELARTSFTITKAILGKKSNHQELISGLKEVNSQLIEEKKRLLAASSFPNDYLTDIYKCSLCKDTGFIDNKKCKCFAANFANLAYSMSNLGDLHKTDNFETFDLSFYSDEIDPEVGKSPKERIQSVLENSLLFIEQFGTQFSNLLLYGKPGLGKTFLCSCISKELLERGKTVLYITSSDLFKVIEYDKFERKNEEEHSQILDIIFDFDLLIIDDLGTEFQTSLTSSALFDIINTRYIRQKPIIISTNLSPQNLANKYSDRVVSRLYGNYDFLEFLGDDIRILKLTKGQNI